MQRSALTTPALGPIGLDLGRLLGVLQRICPVLFRGIRRGSVGEKNVVCGLEFDGLGELVAINPKMLALAPASNQ